MFFKSVLISCVFFLALTSPVNAAIPKLPLENDAQIQQKVLTYVNEYRQQHGLPPLKMDSFIAAQARQHSLDMANHRMAFGHKYFEKRISKLRSQIKNAGAGAENIAYNYKNAREVVHGWIHSSGHKRNIEGPYDLTGIGLARDKQGKLYYTQIFIQTGNQRSNYIRRWF